MKFRLLFAMGIILVGCSKASPKVEDAPPETADNAMTHYVGALQSDVKQAESAVNRMNRSVEKSERAVNEGQ